MTAGTRVFSRVLCQNILQDKGADHLALRQPIQTLGIRRLALGSDPSWFIGGPPVFGIRTYLSTVCIREMTNSHTLVKGRLCLKSIVKPQSQVDPVTVPPKACTDRHGCKDLSLDFDKERKVQTFHHTWEHFQSPKVNKQNKIFCNCYIRLAISKR